MQSNLEILKNRFDNNCMKQAYGHVSIWTALNNKDKEIACEIDD